MDSAYTEQQEQFYERSYMAYMNLIVKKLEKVKNKKAFLRLEQKYGKNFVSQALNFLSEDSLERLTFFEIIFLNPKQTRLRVHLK